MPDHGLSDEHVEIIRTILKPYAQNIDSVGLFGSRAAGTYRDNSDIDMVVYGPLNEDKIDQLWTSFDSSPLPFKVDVIAYDLITYDPLRNHIDQVMLPIFSKADLNDNS